jgi:hypothetical protein
MWNYNTEQRFGIIKFPITSLFFISLFCICPVHFCFSFNKEIRALSKLIVKKPFKKKNQEKIKAIILENPKKAFTLLYPWELYRNFTAPLHTAIEINNKEIIYFILDSLKITSRKKHITLCVSFDFDRLDIALDLMKNYDAPLILPKSHAPKYTGANSYTLYDSPFTFLIRHAIESPRKIKKKLYLKCLSFMLSKAKYTLSKKEFYQFTRYGHERTCPFKTIERRRYGIFYFIPAYLDIYEVPCDTFNFHPMKQLVKQDKYTDL